MNLNDYASQCRHDNDKWWKKLVCGGCGRDLKPGETCHEKLVCLNAAVSWMPITDRNKGELIALMHSELSEALEGVRKNLQDEKLPHRKAEEVELVDCLIFDYAGAFGLDLEGAYQEKRAYNSTRTDHSFEARAKADGKAF